MIQFCLTAFSLLLLASCSLVHREKPNDAPLLQPVSADTLQVRRGGQISLEILATDEDDDPLFYRWDSFGQGQFSDTTCVVTSAIRCNEIFWIAPSSIGGESEVFLIRVTIRDRQCEIVQGAAEREQCESAVGESVESVLIEVLQTPPTVQVIADTTVFFDGGPISIDALGTDAENDALFYEWVQTAGDSVVVSAEVISPNRSRMTFTPPVIGDYGFRIEADDGSDVATGDTAVHVVENPEEGSGEEDGTTGDGSDGDEASS